MCLVMCSVPGKKVEMKLELESGKEKEAKNKGYNWHETCNRLIDETDNQWAKEKSWAIKKLISIPTFSPLFSSLLSPKVNGRISLSPYEANAISGEAIFMKWDEMKWIGRSFVVLSRGGCKSDRFILLDKSSLPTLAIMESLSIDSWCNCNGKEDAESNDGETCSSSSFF